MIKVAFLGSDFPEEWMGGVNYLSNLLYAVSQLEDKQIEPIVFLGKKADVNIVQKFQPYTTIVYDSLFDKKSLKWFVSKIFERVFKTTFFIDSLLEKYDISIVSHSSETLVFEKVMKINWITDFQHVHLPNYFSHKANQERDAAFLKVLKESDTIIVSSYDAYNDTKNFSPEYIDKVKVLQFVSQPNKKVFTLNKNHLKDLEKKYDFQGNFFYLPNQFWKHKNHMLIFNAVKMLKQAGMEILVLCSGHMQDYRNPAYIEKLQSFIQQNKLDSNIRLLGLIDYDDVLYFMRYSRAVINPSLFEGWSSTVEECKSIGKNMLLSDIPIHREQDPEESIYFDPHSIEDVVEKLKETWQNDSRVLPNKNLEIKARDTLEKRTLAFARTYQNIILESMQGLHK